MFLPRKRARIDGIYPVSDAGIINMPFIGTVRAAGLRNEDLAASLQARYKSLGIYTNPTIQVISKTGDSIDEQMVHLAVRFGDRVQSHSARD